METTIEQNTLTLLDLRAKLAQKRLAVINAIKWIPKDGKFLNSDGTKVQYKYTQDADVLDHIKGLLVEHKLLVDFSNSSVANVTETKSGWKVYTVQFTVTVTDAETGFSIESTWIGQGMDGGDKAINKAYTSGQKYWFMKNFLIPTGEEPDKPESDYDSDTKKRGDRNGIQTKDIPTRVKELSDGFEEVVKVYNPKTPKPKINTLFLEWLTFVHQGTSKDDWKSKGMWTDKTVGKLEQEFAKGLPDPIIEMIPKGDSNVN